MKSHPRIVALSTVLLVSSMSCLFMGSLTRADDEEKPKPLKPEVRAATLKLAEAEQKQDTDEIKQQVAVLQKEDAAEFMRVFKLRSRNGLGVGPGGGYPETKDGI